MGLFSRRRPERTTEKPDVPTLDPAMLDRARSVVHPGFVGRAEAVEMVRDHFALEESDGRPEAVVARVWQDRLAEQQTWRGPGDHDRLAAAFAQLGREGVVARMNFACCQNCGTDEIDDERTPLARATAGQYAWQEWAYTFFHQQDAERLADEPTALLLSYSAFRASPDLDPALLTAARGGDAEARRRVRVETDGAVGTMVAKAVREQGLAVEWDGDPDQRITVRITDWRKPLPG